MNTDRRLKWIHQVPVLLGGVLSLLVTSTASAATKPSPFTMANYPVQAEAKDAVTAKKIAIEDGQTAAFRSLLKRIVPVTAYDALERLKSVQASRLIEGTSVRSEQNSSTAYYATLDFDFSAKAVRDLLQREGVPFVETQAAPATLVPVTTGERAPAAQSHGRWGAVWSSLDLANTLAPLRIAEPKQGLGADTLQQLQEGLNGTALSSFKAEYGSETVVLAMAEIDDTGGRLTVTLAGQDAAGPIYWTHAYRITDGDVAYAMEYAAVVSLGVLEGRWKTVKARDMGGVDNLSGPSTSLQIEVLFSSAAEWYRLQQMISTRPGVQGFQVEAVSPRRAEVTLRYPGGGQQLANGLASEGISLTKNGAEWVMRKSY